MNSAEQLTFDPDIWSGKTSLEPSAHEGGEDFRAVLEEAARVCDNSAVIPRPADGWSNAGTVMGDGWSIAWRVFDAQFWGVPQRRRRIALVADFGGYTAPEILFERNSLSGNTPKSKEAREKVAASAEERAGSADIFTLDRASFNQGENAKYDFAVDNDGICPTIVARGGAAVFDSRGNGSGAVVPTLTGDHQSRVTDFTALCIGNGQAGQLKVSDKSRSLSCMHDQQAILCCDLRSCTEGNVNGCLQSSAANNLNSSNVVRIDKAVRRLTPLECERLQGYPDGWTDIGEYTDTQGKKRTASDAARYKALGNSIALPPWAWLLGRLIEYCEEKTMASLFDGIGGFPLIWERLGGKCLWASEIEEFPIAVTKYHFGGNT